MNAADLSLDPVLTEARRAFEGWRGASRLARRRLLEAWEAEVAARLGDLAEGISTETGKPISQALGEVQRGLVTLRATAEAVAAFGEEAVPYDLMPGADGCRAVLRRFPVGPVLAITPFNFPVNLALHKLAPALGPAARSLQSRRGQGRRRSRAHPAGRCAAGAGRGAGAGPAHRPGELHWQRAGGHAPARRAGRQAADP
jgi:delta 1-pyrroline-5-carboxylate dehydrogenase